MPCTMHWRWANFHHTRISQRAVRDVVWSIFVCLRKYACCKVCLIKNGNTIKEQLLVTTLYLTEPYSTVRKDGDTLLVNLPANKETGTEKRNVRVPLMKVEQVVVMADSTITTPALLALLEQQTDICFCDFQ